MLSAVSEVQAQDRKTSVSVLEIKQTDSPITVDGVVEEVAWQQAALLRLDYEHFPEANAQPPVQTQCLIIYNRDNLYIAFKASDPRPEEDIRAQFMDRDNREKFMRNDHIGFTIDPFNNAQWGMQFRVNPLGVQADAVYSNQRNTTNYSWDAIWESEGTITEDGYEVEIRIPISSINIPSGSPQNWRFSAFRNYPRSVQHRIRSHPIDLDQQSLMSQFKIIEGFQDLSSGLNLKINPVLTAKRTDHSAENTRGLDPGPVNLNPGGNIQWGIQPNLNLSATINPDFSQVEADALQLRENRRFVLSFAEKRPFFLESSEIFDTPLQAVFTRSIVEPNAGMKMTGKIGDHSFGTFITQDQSSRLLFPSNQFSESKILNDRSYSEIVRYHNQLNQNASVGLLGEARQSAGSGYHNYVGGIDGYYRFLESNSLQFQFLQSNTNYNADIAANFNQPEKTFGGSALRVNYRHQSQSWTGEAGYTSISSGFRNDNGFFPRANFQTVNANVQRVLRGDSGHWFSSVLLGPSFELTTDQSGKLTDRSFSFTSSYRGPLQSIVEASYRLSRQRYAGQLFSNLDNGVFFVRVQPGGIISKFRVYTAYGEAVDFTNIRRARELIIHPGLTFDLSKNINLEIDPNYQRLSRDGVATFSTYLLGTKMMYHFNKRTFIRSVFQYRYVDRNLGEFKNPEDFASATKSFFYQLLFSYKINPQSKLFLGYSSGYGSINQNPLNIQSRTGYLKVGYAWVL